MLRASAVFRMAEALSFISIRALLTLRRILSRFTALFYLAFNTLRLSLTRTCNWLRQTKKAFLFNLPLQGANPYNTNNSRHRLGLDRENRICILL
ncbi:MAG: hypothetical protein PHD00_09995 [Bacteroidales bacterium]|nr:hypothetical protein [Bacteroidales bacterium]